MMTWSLVSVTEAASVWQYRFAASASSRDRGKRNISRPRAEVRQVEERVEVAFHQLLGTAAEVAVAVLVRELGGGDLRAA
jgi:hypothetical protein